MLIRPDVLSNAPEQTESGVLIARSMAAAIVGEDLTTSVCRGTVIAVGTPRHPLKEEAEALARKMELWANVGHVEADDELDAARMLRDLVRRQPAVAIGDDVLFAHDAGQAITLENETVLLLKEDELLAIVEPEKEQAA